jgi:hypothetical protein
VEATEVDIEEAVEGREEADVETTTSRTEISMGVITSIRTKGGTKVEIKRGTTIIKIEAITTKIETTIKIGTTTTKVETTTKAAIITTKTETKTEGKEATTTGTTKATTITRETTREEGTTSITTEASTMAETRTTKTARTPRTKEIPTTNREETKEKIGIKTGFRPILTKMKEANIQDRVLKEVTKRDLTTTSQEEKEIIIRTEKSRGWGSSRFRRTRSLRLIWRSLSLLRSWTERTNKKTRNP